MKTGDKVRILHDVKVDGKILLHKGIEGVVGEVDPPTFPGFCFVRLGDEKEFSLVPKKVFEVIIHKEDNQEAKSKIKEVWEILEQKQSILKRIIAEGPKTKEDVQFMWTMTRFIYILFKLREKK